ncbi:MAG: hypothetical protein JXJ04_05650 [Spirochaetales bacterium]|nr:hypothetical protein [Spirochaetales bacterium]
MPERKELDLGISKYAREKVIEHLKYSFSHDYLEEIDFEKRLKIALNTNNKQDLNAIVEDLPEVIEENKNEQDHSPSVHINKGVIQQNRKIMSILGSVKRKGVWKPPKNLQMVVVLGDAHLDFTQAEFPPGTTEIDISCVLGSTEIIVPQGVNIENHCISILGEVNDKSVRNQNPYNPTLKLIGKVVLGSLEIKPPRVGLMSRILKKLGID